MKKGISVAGKLFLSYAIFILIFYGTLFVLYLDIRQMMRLSDNIINKHHKISAASKKMIESLFNMEENEKKYFLLKKKDYLGYFLSAKKVFEAGLDEIMRLESPGFHLSDNWRSFADSYGRFAESLGNPADFQSAETLWISEGTINRWVDNLNEARLENEQNLIAANIELNQWGQRAVRYGLTGLVISILVGLIWILFIARSMIRPLHELNKGIRSITRDRYSRAIAIYSKDEFGELAAASNEMAKRLREEELMRSEFITTLSHEIRTPLTSIRESVNLIAEKVMGPTNRRQTKFLKIASMEIGRICELLNHLMHVSRLKEAPLKIALQPMDPAAFIIESIDQFNPVAKSKGIQIRLNIPPETPKAMGDAKHLKQVMINLLGNAIKFSKKNCIILVSAQKHSEKRMIVYAIADNGRGIAKAEQALIFNKYYRAKEIRNHLDGVGLGLNISKQIIEAHGGEIWVTSAPGKGSTFYFTLSLAN